MQRLRYVPLLAAMVALWSAATVHALDPLLSCEASKLKTAGKYDLCRLKAEASAVRRFSTPDFGNCDAKFSNKWVAAETRAMGQCPSTGDEATIRAFITQHTDDVAAALAGGPLPNCPSDLATCNTSLSTCNSNLTSCNASLTATTASLATCNGDLSTCNTNLTAALACGDGAIDGGEQCDQANLNDATCVTQGFAGGTLSCGAGCTFDTGGCYAAPRFVDNADGTITDRQTGLMWAKTIELDGSANYANLHDADNWYLWAGSCSVGGKLCQPTAAASTLCSANADGTAGCDQCLPGEGSCVVSGGAGETETVWTSAAALNAGNFAGYNDWRLPRRSELQSLIDYSKFNPAVNVAFHGASCGTACTDIANPACGCTRSDYDWSASVTQSSPLFSWIVDFGIGRLLDGYRGFGCGFRAVRGGS